MLGKKSSEYRAKKRFLYSHEYRTNKMRGKKRVKQFFLKHTNRATKQFGKKSSEKSAKKRFLYSHNNCDQNMGGKNAANNFSKNTRIVRPKNVGEKIVGKKCEKAFFLFARISYQKNWRKETRETIVPETHE